MRASLRCSRIALCLALVAAVLVVDVVQADTLEACKTRCAVAVAKCTNPKQAMKEGCDALYDPSDPACQRDPQCLFGSIACPGYWSEQIDQCDNNRDGCDKKCAELGKGSTPSV